jgi:hypothetical protein
MLLPSLTDDGAAEAMLAVAWRDVAVESRW